MDNVVALGEWRERHEPEIARLERAVAELDEALAGLERSEAPPWVVTEIFAIQGCMSMDLVVEATERSERLLTRWRRHLRRGKKG